MEKPNFINYFVTAVLEGSYDDQYCGAFFLMPSKEHREMFPELKDIAQIVLWEHKGVWYHKLNPFLQREN